MCTSKWLEWCSIHSRERRDFPLQLACEYFPFFILEALHLRQDIEKPRHLLSVVFCFCFFFSSLNLKEFCVEKQWMIVILQKTAQEIPARWFLCLLLMRQKPPPVISKSLWMIGVVWCIKMVLNLLMLKKAESYWKNFSYDFCCILCCHACLIYDVLLIFSFYSVLLISIKWMDIPVITDR